MARALLPEFFERFKTGDLSALVEVLTTSSHLMMNLRGDYATIYYKGLRVLEIRANGSFGITREYVLISDIIESPIFSKYISNLDDPDYFKLDIPSGDNFPWFDFFTFVMAGIDKWRSSHSEKCEKDIQQRIAMENNSFGDASATDYFIIDTEYVEEGNGKGGRFDAIALKWSRAMRAAHNYCPTLALIEVKNATGAIEGKSGIKKHLEDIEKFAVTDDFYNDLELMISQMRELYLINIPGETELKFNRSEKPQFIFALANYNQRSELLWRNVAKMTEPEKYDLRFATSSFIGYGLFEEGMLTLEQFKSRMPEKFQKKFNQELSGQADE